MGPVEQSARRWRLRDVGPPLVVVCFVGMIGVAGLIRAVQQGSTFAGFLGVVLVGGCIYVLARVVGALRGQQASNGMSVEWPRDGVKRVQAAIRHRDAVDAEDFILAQRYVRRRTWARQNWVNHIALTLVCAVLVVFNLIEYDARSQAVMLVLIAIGIGFEPLLLLRQYRIRRWAHLYLETPSAGPG